ncbi:MAG: 2-isopropylmalate synthase [Syntrophomonadaceae bacterium]|nr:2-isopropylmalate synthase [Syntrophomonadaceae bacterium]
MGNRVYIFDTTLRDGEQSPGVSLNVQEKLEIARQLARLGVDIIEAGFPIVSRGDFESVKIISQKVKGPVIAALARTADQDVDAAWEALKKAETPRIHTFIATSPIHMQYKLQKNPDEVIEAAVHAVKRARGYVEDVEFSCEDGSRSEMEFLCRIVTAVIEAGATTINIPDTVGYSTPEEYAAIIRTLREKVPNSDRARFSVHCHNDLGLAVANSLAAIEAGAEQVECAVNGIGERAGNASLEEIVMALYTRRMVYQKETGINYGEIYRTSRMISTLTGMPIQPNKAIVGKNAFSHESGIHQDGVLKERTTYEIMNPQLIGLFHNNLVLGKHSGRHAFRERLQELGFELNDDELNRAFNLFKALADRKKQITSHDIEAIIKEELGAIPEKYRLDYLHFFSGSKVVPTATVGLFDGETVIEEASIGDGPVDAALKAVDRITQLNTVLNEYSLNAITGGKDALGEVTVRVQFNDRFFIGRGVSTDVIEASVKAYIDAVNKVAYELEKNGNSFPKVETKE